MKIAVYKLDEPLVLTPFPNGGYTITQPNRREPGFRDVELGAYGSLAEALDALRPPETEPEIVIQGVNLHPTPDALKTVNEVTESDLPPMSPPVAEQATDYLGLLNLVWKFNDDLLKLAAKHKEGGAHGAADRYESVAVELGEQLDGGGFARP